MYYGTWLGCSLEGIYATRRKRTGYSIPKRKEREEEYRKRLHEIGIRKLPRKKTSKKRQVESNEKLAERGIAMTRYHGHKSSMRSQRMIFVYDNK